MAGPAKTAVVGLGINNRPLIPYLLEKGEAVVVADRQEPDQMISRLGADEARVEILGGPDYLARLAARDDVATVYVTPGMRKSGPEFDRLRAKGVRVTCETDLFLRICPAPVIGITGSAGKTTTTSLVGQALQLDGRRPVFVGGNIGRPLLPEIGRMTKDSWVVLELSSFQLELVEKSPQGAAILNLSENHLDIHGSMAAYAEAKRKILAFQEEKDWAVLPAADDVVRALAKGHRGRQVFFGPDQELEQGAYSHGGYIWWRDGQSPRSVLAVDQLRIPGRHNLANALAATAIVAMAGGDLEALSQALARFTGVPHRLERVREVGGVVYVNDSIATTPERTRAALAAVSGPIVLIAGGYDKHLDYTPLGRAIASSTVRVVIALGQTREKIFRAVKEEAKVPVYLADSFDEAVALAAGEARAGETVLLSPAAASYDMFRNFEERGQRFRELVSRL